MSVQPDEDDLLADEVDEGMDSIAKGRRSSTGERLAWLARLLESFPTTFGAPAKPAKQTKSSRIQLGRAVTAPTELLCSHANGEASSSAQRALDRLQHALRSTTLHRQASIHSPPALG